MQQMLASLLLIGILSVTNSCGVKGKPLPPLKKGEVPNTRQQNNSQ